jgi:hypothetical protein
MRYSLLAVLVLLAILDAALAFYPRFFRAGSSRAPAPAVDQAAVPTKTTAPLKTKRQFEKSGDKEDDGTKKKKLGPLASLVIPHSAAAGAGLCCACD